MRTKSKEAKIGDAVRSERQRCGYTPKQLAEMVDMDVRTIKEIEQGHAAISIGVMQKLCTALRTTPDVLTAFHDAPIGIRTRLDRIDKEQVLTVYLNGWRLHDVTYCKSGNVQLSFWETDND